MEAERADRMSWTRSSGRSRRTSGAAVQYRKLTDGATGREAAPTESGASRPRERRVATHMALASLRQLAEVEVRRLMAGENGTSPGARSLLACELLNRMLELGRPQSNPVS